MKKKALLIGCIVLCFVFANDAFSQQGKIDEFLKEYKEIITELAKIREKAISEDEELKALHEQILELHAKMALKLDQKPEIRALNDKIINLEKQIENERANVEKKSLLKD